MSLGDIDIVANEDEERKQEASGSHRGVTVREGITWAQMIPSKKQDLDDHHDDGVDEAAFDEPCVDEKEPEKLRDDKSEESSDIA